TARSIPPGHSHSGNPRWPSARHGSGHRSPSTRAARSGARADRCCSWHRVPAAGVKRMAAPDPPHGHAPPAPPAVTGDRLISVLRAGGCESATGHQTEEWAERHPIDPDQRERRGRPRTLSLTNTARYSDAARRPERKVRSKSAERSSRACRFNATEPRGYRARRLAVGVSRRRPLRRRALMTLTPPGLDMRARNPWTLTRWRFFGWWVRFMTVAGSGR